jgi:hypothetical protein
MASKPKALDQLARIFGLYQADRLNDQDRSEAALLNTAFWRFVISLHVHHGITVAEAIELAQREPEAVGAWARAKGLLPAADQGDGARRTPA